MPTQHIATLLGATCCMRLATMLRCVATRWVLLAQVWKWSNLSQQHPTCRNTSQHGGQMHALNMLRPTMSRYVALAYCDRLAGLYSQFINSLTVKLWKPRTTGILFNVIMRQVKIQLVKVIFLFVCGMRFAACPKLYCDWSVDNWIKVFTVFGIALHITQILLVYLIEQFRYLKIQPNTILREDLGTRLWGTNPTKSVVMPQSLVLRSLSVLGWILIQLFRQRSSHKSVKAYATMPIGIMDRKNLAFIDWGSRCLPTRKEKV